MQFDRIRRREFITLLGGATAGLAARGAGRSQRPGPSWASFTYASATTLQHLAEAVRRGLQEVGYVENQNVAIEYRWADGHYERLPALAAELVRRQVAVNHSWRCCRGAAAKEATASIGLSSPAARTRSRVVSSGASAGREESHGRELAGGRDGNQTA